MSHHELPEAQLAQTKLRRHQHVCAFFHGHEEGYGVLLPFVKEGIERGEKAFHIVSSDIRDDHLDRLRGIGLDTDALERALQLEVIIWEQAYLRNNDAFVMGDMLDLLRETLEANRAQGYALTRGIAHMEWALGDRLGVEDLIEYECRLNTMLRDSDDLIICVYDISQFGAGTVIDILRTHPMVIIGGILQDNPFYVPPDEFLLELKSR